MIKFSNNVNTALSNASIQSFYMVKIYSSSKTIYSSTTHYADVILTDGSFYSADSTIISADPPQLSTSVDREIYKITIATADFLSTEFAPDTSIQKGLIGYTMESRIGFISKAPSVETTYATYDFNGVTTPSGWFASLGLVTSGDNGTGAGTALTLTGLGADITGITVATTQTGPADTVFVVNSTIGFKAGQYVTLSTNAINIGYISLVNSSTSFTMSSLSSSPATLTQGLTYQIRSPTTNISIATLNLSPSVCYLVKIRMKLVSGGLATNFYYGNFGVTNSAGYSCDLTQTSVPINTELKLSSTYGFKVGHRLANILTPTISIGGIKTVSANGKSFTLDTIATITAGQNYKVIGHGASDSSYGGVRAYASYPTTIAIADGWVERVIDLRTQNNDFMINGNIYQLRFDIGAPISVVDIDYVKVGYYDQEMGKPMFNVSDTILVYKGAVESLSASLKTGEFGESFVQVSGSSPMNSLDMKKYIYLSKEATRKRNYLDTCCDQIYQGSGALTLKWGKS